MRSAHTLLREALSARLMLANLAHPGRTLGYDPLLQPLPRLFRDVERLVPLKLPENSGGIVDRLDRLNRELNWITLGTWAILDDQLPRVFLDVLEMVKCLVFPDEIGPGLVAKEHRQHMTERLAAAERRLLVLQGEAIGRESDRIEKR